MLFWNPHKCTFKLVQASFSAVIVVTPTNKQGIVGIMYTYLGTELDQIEDTISFCLGNVAITSSYKTCCYKANISIVLA